MERPCFHVPGRPGIIDECFTGADGQLRGHYSNETLEQINLRYPGAVVGELATISAASREMFKSPPEEISEEKYIEMLEVLPPEGWVTMPNGDSSFKMMEYLYNDITGIYARIGARYFFMQGPVTTPHADIIAAIQKSFPNL